MNWKDSFLHQARSDYDMFNRLNRSKNPEVQYCHRLHYLQMATEKLAKGYFYNGTQVPPAKTHYALGRLLRIIKGRPDFREHLGYSGNPGAFASYIDSLLPIAWSVEQLAPVGGNFDKLNAEYPWLDNGLVQCPAEYTYPEFPKTDMVKFYGLFASLFRVIR